MLLRHPGKLVETSLVDFQCLDAALGNTRFGIVVEKGVTLLTLGIQDGLVVLDGFRERWQSLFDRFGIPNCREFRLPI